MVQDFGRVDAGAVDEHVEVDRLVGEAERILGDGVGNWGGVGLVMRVG